MNEPGLHDWGGDWESRRRAQLTSGLGATPKQRVEWLLAMIELAWRTGALPRPRDAWGRILPRAPDSGP